MTTIPQDCTGWDVKWTHLDILGPHFIRKGLKRAILPWFFSFLAPFLAQFDFGQNIGMWGVQSVAMECPAHTALFQLIGNHPAGENGKKHRFWLQLLGNYFRRGQYFSQYFHMEWPGELGWFNPSIPNTSCKLGHFISDFQCTHLLSFASLFKTSLKELYRTELYFQKYCFLRKADMMTPVKDLTFGFVMWSKLD